MYIIIKAKNQKKDKTPFKIYRNNTKKIEKVINNNSLIFIKTLNSSKTLSKN